MNQLLDKIKFVFIFLIFSYQTTNAQNGVVKSYYADGTIQSEASYVNDVLDGAYITYFPDGKVKLEKNFSGGILDGYVREFYKSGMKKNEYLVKFGIKDGSLREYYEDGRLKELLIYSDGVLASSQFFKSENDEGLAVELPPTEKKTDAVSLSKESVAKKLEPVSSKVEPTNEKREIDIGDKKLSEYKPESSLHQEDYELLCDAQVCPVPIGGMKGIQDNLVYPEHALRYGLEGTVTIIATINALGDVIKTQVLKKLGFGCDEAAQEVLRKTKFIPGKTNNEPIETNATIKIEFKIFNKKSAQ